MNAPVRLSGHSAFEAAALAAVKLCGVVWGGNETLIGSCRDTMIASLERLQETGVDSPWVRWRLESLCNEATWRADWTEESGELIKLLGELMALDEAVAAASSAPALRDGQPAALASGAEPTAEDTSWKCWARRHSMCPGHCISRGTCLCACHGRAEGPSSRPASPPPPSGDGDELALEMAAGYAATGDTLPPLAEACGPDTEPPGPGSVEWWDEQPIVKC